MNWSEHRYGPGIKVIFTPRESYAGRPAIEYLLAHTGEHLTVRPLWLMEKSDPYPGEWALGNADRSKDIFGRTWIASGDVQVIPIEKVDSQQQSNLQIEDRLARHGIPIPGDKK